MTPRRILLTGSSGYYGRAVIDAVRLRWPDAEVMGFDIVPPPASHPDRFERCDLTTPAFDALAESFRPDCMIHLAFVVNPMRDEQRAREINVGGTRRFLAVADRIRPASVVVSSSATAYGAWPDNPIPMHEDQPLRGRRDFRYAADKHEIESLLSEFASSHPEVRMAWTRPCMIYGPGMSNFMTTLFTATPVLTLPGGLNPSMQFVHLDDVAGATLEIIASQLCGPVNVAPPDWFTIRDLARMSRRPALPAPLWACKAVSTCWWALRLPVFRFPATLWSFIAYSWVISPERLLRETPFRFRYSSADVIRMLLKDHRLLREKAPTGP